jgi:hypothetical protein
MATTARVSRRALLTASAATLAGTAVVAAPGLLRLLPDLLAALALVAGGAVVRVFQMEVDTNDCLLSTRRARGR